MVVVVRQLRQCAHDSDLLPRLVGLVDLMVILNNGARTGWLNQVDQAYTVTPSHNHVR
jgi:hypothetical protein